MTRENGTVRGTAYRGAGESPARQLAGSPPTPGERDAAPRPAIVAIGTAVPRYRLDQQAVGDWMAEQIGAGPALAKWLSRLYARSGISNRHTCVPESDRPRFLAGARAVGSDVPTTAERMAIYERESVRLGTEAASRTLADFAAPSDVAEQPGTGGLSDLAGQRGTRGSTDLVGRSRTAGQAGAAGSVAPHVTHLIVVSCTGFFAPGLDAALAQSLNLRPDVERTVVGFMGCAAAFNALRLAADIVAGRPSALVLIVCIELCTIHLQASTDREQLVASSLFADGAAACLVGQARGGPHAPVTGGRDAFEIQSFYTNVQPEHSSDMSWSIGNHGFVMRLSPNIPKLVSEAGPAGISRLWGGDSRPTFWAIHPGGRSILDRVAETFQLGEAEMASSRSVLRRYGNLSSPTILFVLDTVRRELRRQSDLRRVAGGDAGRADEPSRNADGDGGRFDRVTGTDTASGEVEPVSGAAGSVDGVAMGFGPGLVTEMLRLKYVPAPVRARIRPATEPLRSDSRRAVARSGGSRPEGWVVGGTPVRHGDPV